MTDFCILCGCDYVKNIPGVGPNKAYDYLKEYGTADKVAEHLVATKNFKDKLDEKDYLANQYS